MKPTQRLPISSLTLLLILAATATAQELPMNVQQRLDRVESTLNAFQKVDTLQIVISNSAGSDVTINLRDDATQPWQAIKLTAGQTITFNHAEEISLVTPKGDSTFYDHTYQLEGGNKFVIYWNQAYWDLIRVSDQTAR